MMAVVFWFCIGLILYTYVGYPILLSLLVRLKSKQQEAFSEELPKITLLIAAYNEASVIAKKIENSLALSYPRESLQILVTADGSSDATPDVVRNYADRGVELLYAPPRRGKMAAINRALPEAWGDVVLFSDANNMYAEDTLRHIVAPFSDPTVGAVSGAKSIIKGDGALGDSEGLYWQYESFVKKQETKLSSCAGVAGEILAIRRELFEAPPDHIINDDFYMAMRFIKRGYRVVYAPKARSYERVSLSAQDEVARRSRIIAGRYQAIALAGALLPWDRPLVAWQIVSHKYLRPLVPLAMIGALLSNVLLVLLPVTGGGFWELGTPYSGLFLVGQTLFYLGAWAGGYLNKGKIGKILYVPHFLVNSNLAALIGLYRYLTGQQTALWQRVQRRGEGE